MYWFLIISTGIRIAANIITMAVALVMSFVRRDQLCGLYQGSWAGVSLSPSGWLEVAIGDFVSRVGRLGLVPLYRFRYGSCRLAMVIVDIVQIQD